jgi:hypothetical protein
VHRVVDELLWTLRREGFSISPAQVIDVMRAIEIVGFDDRRAFEDAIACIVVQRAVDRARFDTLVQRFFAADGPHARDLMGRLRALGFDAEVLSRLSELLEAVAGPGDASGEGAALLLALLGGATLEHRLLRGDVRRALACVANPIAAGFHAQKVMGLVGMPGATRALAKLRMALEGAFGADVGKALADALARELDAARGAIRAHVSEIVRRSADGAPAPDATSVDLPFTSLDPRGVDEVRRAVRILAERLRGASRVRERHGRRGRIDVHRTLRAAMRTGGVPIVPVRRRRRRDKPRLFVLCDVSDSVRVASVFLLEFVAVAQEVFDRTRTFVFVSDLAETTRLFEDSPLDAALASILGGRAVSLAHNSSYGRALRTFDERCGRAIDRRSTVVILGDGRTNYQPAEIEVVARLRDRARAVIWLCPEPRSSWGTGDSAMGRYAAAVTEVLSASSAAELEVAARAILRRR